MKTQPIDTSLGRLHGRNAIYLDEFRHIFTPSVDVFFKGALSTSCCKGYKGTADFVAYELLFEGVQFYSCCELELYKKEPFLSSSFDLVLSSHLLQDLNLGNDYQHYIVATYDFVYEIAAKMFKMKIHE